MTSQDSGIETGNDSNDSSYPAQEANECSPMKMVNFVYQPGTLSSQVNQSIQSSEFDKIKIGMPTCSKALHHQSQEPQPIAEPRAEWGNINWREGDSASGERETGPIHWKRERIPTSAETPMFRLPNPRPSALDLEPPAGLSFNNVQPSSLGLGGGYEIIGIGQDFVYRNIELQLKLKAVRCRLRSARDAWAQFKTPLDERKLRRAVSMNNMDQVVILLSSGVNPNSSDAHRRTPLHLAACRGYTDILRYLLSRGADPNKKDALGNTPLHIAACTNNVEIVTLLIKAGTDVSTGDNSGRNPLQIAQSKLKLLQRCRSQDAERIKGEIAQVVEMMQTFLHKRGQEMEAELLNAFTSRLSLSDTPAKVETDVRDLLASLSGLNLGQSQP